MTNPTADDKATATATIEGAAYQRYKRNPTDENRKAWLDAFNAAAEALDALTGYEPSAEDHEAEANEHEAQGNPDAAAAHRDRAARLRKQGR